MDQLYYVLIEQPIVSDADLKEAVGMKQHCLVEDYIKEVDADEFVEKREAVLLCDKGLEANLCLMGAVLSIENCEILIVVLFIAQVY